MLPAVVAPLKELCTIRRIMAPVARVGPFALAPAEGQVREAGEPRTAASRPPRPGGTSRPGKFDKLQGRRLYAAFLNVGNADGSW
jgi:hypothetical protein